MSWLTTSRHLFFCRRDISLGLTLTQKQFMFELENKIWILSFKSKIVRLGFKRISFCGKIKVFGECVTAGLRFYLFVHSFADCGCFINVFMLSRKICDFVAKYASLSHISRQKQSYTWYSQLIISRHLNLFRDNVAKYATLSQYMRKSREICLFENFQKSFAKWATRKVF